MADTTEFTGTQQTQQGTGLIPQAGQFLSNVQKIKVRVYEDLKNAINCKIILLSGTPIVNNCYEISYISNILNGTNILYKYEYIVHSSSTINNINNIKIR